MGSERLQSSDVGSEQEPAEGWPQLVGALSHELRHEVSAVMHQIELLDTLHNDTLHNDTLHNDEIHNDETRSDATSMRRSLDALGVNAERLMRFVEHLDELGRIARMERRAQCRPIDVSHLVCAAIEDRVHTVEWTPPQSDPVWSVHADQAAVTAIVTSLLDHLDDVDAGESVAVDSTRVDENFIDLRFAATASWVGPTYRPATIDDGLSLFVAHLAAQSMGGEFGPSTTTPVTSFTLRLVDATSDRASQQ